MLTPAFLASAWCAGEVAIARSRGCRLLPVRAQPDVVHPLLAVVHHVDWTADPTVAERQLLEALRMVDATRGWVGRMGAPRSPACVRSALSSTGCSSAGAPR